MAEHTRSFEIAREAMLAAWSECCRAGWKEISQEYRDWACNFAHEYAVWLVEDGRYPRPRHPHAPPPPVTP